MTNFNSLQKNSFTIVSFWIKSVHLLSCDFTSIEIQKLGYVSGKI